MSDDYYYSGPYAEEQAEAQAATEQGGYWKRVSNGWNWCAGSTFPTPGGNAIYAAVPVRVPEPPSAPVGVEVEYEYEYEVWQGDALQAGGSTADYASAQSEANHYAMMYAQDGSVEVRIYEKRLLSTTQQPAARPPKPTECMNGCPDRQVCNHCQWPLGPDQRPAAVDGSNAQASIDAALRERLG